MGARTASGLHATLSSGIHADHAGQVDRAALKTAAITALSRGYAVSKVEDRVACTLPAEAVSIVASALGSLDTVPAEALESCTSERYALNPKTKIAAATKCSSCVYRISGHCSKQSCKIEGSAKSASELIAGAVQTKDRDPSEQYRLYIPRMTVNASAKESQGATSNMDNAFGQNVTLDNFFLG